MTDWTPQVPLDDDDSLTDAFDLLAVLHQPWRHQAACKGRTALMFPDTPAVNEAKAVCRSCPVRAECADYALTHNEPDGIWGGMSARERRRIRKRTAA